MRTKVKQITKKEIKNYLDLILARSCCISTIKRLDEEKVIVTDISSVGVVEDFTDPFNSATYEEHYALAFMVKKELEELGFIGVPVQGAPKEAFCYVYSIDTNVLEAKMKVLLRKEKAEAFMDSIENEKL